MTASSKNFKQRHGGYTFPLLRRTIISTIFVLIAPLAMAQTVYKWVDENGTVHFGERPPMGVEATPVNVPQATSGLIAERPAGTDPDELSYAEQQRKDRNERIAEQRAEAQRIATACEAQRGLVAQLEPRPKVLIQNPDGTTRMLGDEERLNALNTARDFIEKNCQ